MKYWRSPLDLETIQVTKGRVVVIEERCKGCELCIEYCPRDVIQMSAAYNVKGYHFPEVVDKPACVNCHFCEALCPDFAIFSVAEA
jgi:2-oxoglutarate ferredoxin oxidoreductase subunit delta